ncbi:MAG: hypothetical protein HZC18_05785 [Candidatus Omnitrophica bacterium]|nr:hypothetical protein [Candidatus Omnitrophota bacterium]
MPLMNSATGFRAHSMLEVVVKGITLLYYFCFSGFWLPVTGYWLLVTEYISQ